MLDTSACVVGLVEHSAHPLLTMGRVDDRDDLALGDEFASGLDLVQNAANRHQDVRHIRAATVIPDGAVEDDTLAERVADAIVRVVLREGK